MHNYEPRHLHRAVDFLRRTLDRHPWQDVVGAPIPLAELDRALRKPPAGTLRAAVAPTVRR
ncbi:hypothetical protein ACFXK0_15890 [Nocardia sp. NPDC059177]|uniref:hypothetical protein n=1 Tax=Nocardia sp. NPDC059177 TaxID=3346759 RepID=UPI00367A584E